MQKTSRTGRHTSTGRSIPISVDQQETRSTCPYCGVACGVIIASHGPQITGVRGDPDHPANFGRLCMSSAVAGYKKTLGMDAPPACYDDVNHAGTIFMVGANTAYAHPVLFRRIEDAKRVNPELKIICCDPRRTDTAEIADLCLAIQPGTDVALFNGMLHNRLAGVNALISSACCPESLQPEFKHTAVKALKAELPWTLLAPAWLPAGQTLSARPKLDETLLQDEFPAQAYGRALLVPGSTLTVPVVSRGQPVCACLNVTDVAIDEDLGRCSGSPTERLASLKGTVNCGTQCGSCLPELKKRVRISQATTQSALY